MLEACLLRCLAAMARVRAAAVVKTEVTAGAGARFADRSVFPQVNYGVFDRAPQAQGGQIVAPRASAVHADRDLRALKDRDSRQASIRRLNQSTMATRQANPRATRM